MEACGINFFYLRAVFPLTLMLATASVQVCVPLGHSSLYLEVALQKIAGTLIRTEHNDSDF